MYGFSAMHGKCARCSGRAAETASRPSRTIPALADFACQQHPAGTDPRPLTPELFPKRARRSELAMELAHRFAYGRQVAHDDEHPEWITARRNAVRVADA